MLKKKDISIIIPHYESYKGLRCLLDTIPNLINVQVIVVDDNSKDISEIEIIKNSYDHVKFIHNETGRKGAGVARNIGLNLAEGEWILFADSDDYFTSKAFETILSDINVVKPDVDLIYYKPTSIDLASGITSNRHLVYEELIKKNTSNSPRYEDIRYLFFVPWSKLIRRDLINRFEINFDEVLASNDVMFSTKTGHYARNIEVRDSIIYCVTKSPGTLTARNDKNVIDSRYKVMIDYNKFLNKVGKNSYQVSVLQIAMRYKEAMNIIRFFDLILLSIKYRFKLFPNGYWNNKLKSKFFNVN